MEKIKNYTQFKIKALEILEQEHEEKIKEIYGNDLTTHNYTASLLSEDAVQSEIIGKNEMKFAYIIYINFDVSIKESLEISKEDITPQFDERLNKNKI